MSSFAFWSNFVKKICFDGIMCPDRSLRTMKSCSKLKEAITKYRSFSFRELPLGDPQNFPNYAAAVWPRSGQADRLKITCVPNFTEKKILTANLESVFDSNCEKPLFHFADFPAPPKSERCLLVYLLFRLQRISALQLHQRKIT